METLRIRTKGYVIKQELIFIRKDRTNIPERTRTFILKKKTTLTLTDRPIIVY